MIYWLKKDLSIYCICETLMSKTDDARNPIPK